MIVDSRWATIKVVLLSVPADQQLLTARPTHMLRRRTTLFRPRSCHCRRISWTDRHSGVQRKWCFGMAVRPQALAASLTHKAGAHEPLPSTQLPLPEDIPGQRGGVGSSLAKGRIRTSVGRSRGPSRPWPLVHLHRPLPYHTMVVATVDTNGAVSRGVSGRGCGEAGGKYRGFTPGGGHRLRPRATTGKPQNHAACVWY